MGFTIGNAAVSLAGAALAHLGLAWPTGRLRSRFERGVVVAEYASAARLTLLGMLFWDPAFSGCDASCPANLLLVRGSRPPGPRSTRLQAEIQVQLDQVRASRARIVEAGDAERRRWNATCTTARSSGSSRSRWRSAIARDRAAGADPDLGGAARIRVQGGPGRPSPSCASWPAASTPPCSPRPGWRAHPGAGRAIQRARWRVPGVQLGRIALTSTTEGIACIWVKREALANVAKHAQGRQRSGVHRAGAAWPADGDRSSDDGAGGASAGSRLRAAPGWRDRVRVGGRRAAGGQPGRGRDQAGRRTSRVRDPAPRPSCAWSSPRTRCCCARACAGC